MATPPCSADSNKNNKKKNKTFLKRTLDEHTGSINAICLTNDRQTIVTGSEDHTARIWDVKTEECTALLEGHTNYITSVCVSDEHVFTASADYSIRKWDLKTGECVYEFNGHNSTVNKIIYSQGLLFSGSYDRTARCWNAEHGDCLRTFEGHRRGIYPLLLISNSKTKRTHIDMETSDDILVTGSADFTAKSWGMNSSECLLSYKGHKGAVLSLAVDSTKRTLFTGSTDTTIRVWDLMSGANTKVLEGHQGSVLNLQVIPDTFKYIRFILFTSFYL